MPSCQWFNPKKHYWMKLLDEGVEEDDMYIKVTSLA
jgi:hypothetical protein